MGARGDNKYKFFMGEKKETDELKMRRPRACALRLLGPTRKKQRTTMTIKTELVVGLNYDFAPAAAHSAAMKLNRKTTRPQRRLYRDFESNRDYVA